MSVATGNAIQLSELAALADVANAALSPGTPYDFASGGTDYMTTLNRIRSDLLAKIFTDDTSPLYLNRDALTGGPQCVSINPNWTPDGDYWQGKLALNSVTVPIDGGTWLPYFKAIGFLMAASDEDFSGTSPLLYGDNQYWTGTDDQLKLFWGVRVLELPSGPVKSFTWVEYHSPDNITRTVDPWGTISGTSPNLTVSHTFEYTATVAGNLIITIKLPLAAGGYEDHTINQWVDAGSGTIDFSATGDYAIQPDVTTPAFEPPADYPQVHVAAELFWPADTTRTGQDIIHPTSSGVLVTATDIDIADFRFTLDLRYGCPWLGVNVPLITGCWLANTLPTPAVNGYLDTQFAPYVQKVLPANWPTAVPGFGFDYGSSTACAGNAREIYSGDTLMNPRTSLSQAAPIFIEYPEPTNPYTTVPLAAGGVVHGALTFPYWLYAPWDPYGLDRDATTVPDFVSASASIDWYAATTPITSPSDPAALYINTGASLTATDVCYVLGTFLTKFFWLAYNPGGGIPDFTYVLSRYKDVPDRIRPTEPAIGPMPVRWPVIRNTDAYPFYPGMDPYRAKRDLADYSLAPGEHYGEVQLMLLDPDNAWHDMLYSNSTGLPIYVKTHGPPTVPGGPYDFVKTDGRVTLADLISHGITATQFVYFTTYNNTGSNSSGTITFRSENLNVQGNYDAKPVLIPFQWFTNDNPVHDVLQALSFNILDEDGAEVSPKPVPRCGQVIYSLLVRRHSVEAIKATRKDPSIFLQVIDLPLTVSIGQYRGLRHSHFETIVADSYQELVSVTIPAGVEEIRVPVFWPVLHGACLVYSASKQVNIEALVCWQPMFHSRQYAAAPTQSSDGGRVAGASASAWYPETACKYTNHLDISKAGWDTTKWSSGFCQFPIAADVYNSHMAALALLL